MRGWAVLFGVCFGPGSTVLTAAERTIEVPTVAIVDGSKARSELAEPVRLDLRTRAQTEARATLHPDGRVTIECGPVRDLRRLRPAAAKADRP